MSFRIRTPKLTITSANLMFVFLFLWDWVLLRNKIKGVNF